jgi:integrase
MCRRLEESVSGLVEWDASNCHKAVRSMLDGSGFEWATGHSFRRTAAALAAAGGAPLMDIADRLGHADPSMTARVYLGRDLFGESASVADHL